MLIAGDATTAQAGTVNRRYSHRRSQPAARAMFITLLFQSC